MLKDVPDDASMSGSDSLPQRACDSVLMLHEGGEEQRVLLALEENFGWQPDAGPGTKERELRTAAPHFPAEHGSSRSS